MADHDPDQHCNDLVALFSKAPIKKTFGMSLSFNDNREAAFEFPHNPDLEHALDDTHGGVIATLLDNAGWFTAAAAYPTWIVTAEMQMRLLEPAKKEALVATGRLIRAGKRLAMCEMQVHSKSGRLIATGSATFAITAFEYPSS